MNTINSLTEEISQRIIDLKLPLKYNHLHQEITESDNTVICKLYFPKDFTNDQDTRTQFGKMIVNVFNAGTMMLHSKPTMPSISKNG